jgi:glycosyltransferase involved in cell wall biosynthesis
MDRISVVMPTYNRAAYIGSAIESVLRQSYRDFELIIIDDGSTDDTRNLVAPFLKDQRVRYILQNNEGAAAARNHGLAVRRGKYVAFIDSDDTWESNKLELQIRVMEALPEVSVVCSDFSSVDSKGCRETSHIRSYFKVFDNYELSYEEVFQNILTESVEGLQKDKGVYWGNIYETMLFGNVILTSTCLCREEVFKNTGLFDTNYSTLEDYDLFLRISNKYPVAFIDKPLVCYRYNVTQLSGDLHFEKLCINLTHIFLKNISNIKDEEFLRKNRGKIKRHIGLIQSMQAYFYFSHDKMPLAADFYWKSVRNNPGMIKSYLYLLFSVLPPHVTHMIRKLKPAGRASTD